MDSPAVFTSTAALLEAVDIAGGQTALARQMTEHGSPTRQQQVWKWINAGKRRVPAEVAPLIEKVTGVPVERLRGDLAWTRDADGKPARFWVAVNA